MPRKKKDDDDSGLMDRAQVARFYKCSVRTVNRRVQARLMPPPVRGTHLWTRSSLLAHIEAAALDKAAEKKKAAQKKKPTTTTGTSYAPSQKAKELARALARAQRR